MTTVSEEQNRFRGHGLDVNDGIVVNFTATGTYTKYGWPYKVGALLPDPSGLFGATIRVRNINCSGEQEYDYSQSPHLTITQAVFGAGFSIGGLEVRDGSTATLAGVLMNSNIDLYNASFLYIQGSNLTIDGVLATDPSELTSSLTVGQRHEIAYTMTGGSETDTFGLTVHSPLARVLLL